MPVLITQPMYRSLKQTSHHSEFQLLITIKAAEEGRGNMTVEQLYQHKTEYKAKIEEYKKQLDEEYDIHIDAFLNDNVRFDVGNVIEKVRKNPSKRAFKHTRMAIYEIGITWFKDKLIVFAYGWYLDKDSIPVKWEGAGLAVYGAWNSDYDLILSDNQENKPVPKDLGGKE